MAAGVDLEPSCVSLTFTRPGDRAWVRVESAAVWAEVTLNGHGVGTHLGAWTPFTFELTPWLRDSNHLEVRCEWRDHVTNGFLPRLGMRWVGARGVRILTHPPEIRPPARQRSQVRGTHLLVDGTPLRVRGVLHWGYYPERGGPWPDEALIREEIATLRGMGFNLIKFCLWIPPERYLDLCDEMGMLVWQEYPVWDAPLDDPRIVSEYEEFFRFDGPHPCVILRTLTCENDRIDPSVAHTLIETARRMIPGCVVLDNSSWLCAERIGDFHDEHVYLNPMQWRYYPSRVRHKLTKPLLLGESMCVDSPPEGPHRTALEVRKFQIQTLSRDLPGAGYVVTALRDTPTFRGGLLTEDGRWKHQASEWAWHREPLEAPREIPDCAGFLIGPRKGEWKCPEVQWWSPVIECTDERLPQDLIQEECAFGLLSGRVLANCEGTNVLVWMVDYHSGSPTRHPMVACCRTMGTRRVVSAFRHDTHVGRRLWEILVSTAWDAPEIGPLVGDAVVLETWELSLDGRTWFRVRCDTPLVNRGANVFEGCGLFRAAFDYPGGEWILRCESVADWYEIAIDGSVVGEAGNRTGTWDGTRYVPRSFPVDLAPGRHEIVVHVRDWTAAGCMVGPVYFTRDLSLRVF